MHGNSNLMIFQWSQCNDWILNNVILSNIEIASYSSHVNNNNNKTAKNPSYNRPIQSHAAEHTHKFRLLCVCWWNCRTILMWTLYFRAHRWSRVHFMPSFFITHGMLTLIHTNHMNVSGMSAAVPFSLSLCLCVCVCVSNKWNSFTTKKPRGFNCLAFHV